MLADVLARIADHQLAALAQLLPWNWPGGRHGGLIVPAPSSAFTIARSAEILGDDERLDWSIAQ